MSAGKKFINIEIKKAFSLNKGKKINIFSSIFAQVGIFHLNGNSKG